MYVAPGLPIDAAVGLLLVALVIATVTRWVAVPYTVALLVAGMAIGLVHPVGGLNLTRQTIFLLFMPALLFQAAIEIPWCDLRRDLAPVLTLAVGGVALSLVMVGMGTHLITGLPVGVALVFGAIVAATDPTAVVALFRDLKIHRRITLLIEAESLLNDGVAATLFITVVAANLGQSLSPGASIVMFLQEAVGGVVAGALLGWLMSFLTGRVDDVLIETSLTLVLAYGSYLVADHFGLSGILAVVGAGLVVGNHGLPNRTHPEVRLSIEQFWRFAAFIANSLLFLLMGLKATAVMHLFYWGRDLTLTALIVGCRGLMVAALLAVSCRGANRVPLNWQALITWGGLRGAVSIALVLGLPITFPDRDVLLGAVFSTTLITLLFQGITVRPLLTVLHIPMASQTDEA